jgi:hypothetical protein
MRDFFKTGCVAKVILQNFAFSVVSEKLSVGKGLAERPA